MTTSPTTDAAILFVDLTSSSEFASVLDIQEYGAYVRSFCDLCETQCRFFFDTFLGGRYERDTQYKYNIVGDELVVFLHTGNPANDVYQLIVLSIALKCGWLGMPQNAKRLANGIAATELAAGINFGRILLERIGDATHRIGFAINLAKRIETSSRQGSRFRIAVSDSAFKQVNRRMRNLLFGPRAVLPLKGVVVPTGMYEVADSFIDPCRRLAPEYVDQFRSVAKLAIHTNSFDLWIHSCLQVSQEQRHGSVSSDMREMCRYVLNLDPDNAVGLYYAGQGCLEAGAPLEALCYFDRLVKAWPLLGDGWLQQGRCLEKLGRLRDAEVAMIRARQQGVSDDETALAKPEA